jgi:hypothetical protein
MAAADRRRPKVVRLDDLPGPQRRIVAELLAAANAATVRAPERETRAAIPRPRSRRGTT